MVLEALSGLFFGEGGGNYSSFLLTPEGSPSPCYCSVSPPFYWKSGSA